MVYTEERSLAVVIPVYKGALTVGPLVMRLNTVLSDMTVPFRIILVDDRSPDESWRCIQELCTELSGKVVGIRLSRNFGQHPAITAGLRAVQEDYVIIMDCDLQDSPEEIPKLWSKMKEGFPIVLARRHARKDSFVSRNGSRFFYGLLSYLSGYSFDAAIANFGVYERRCINAVLSMGDYFRFFPVMIQWIGFKYAYVNVEHQARTDGNSTYTLLKKVVLALNVMLFFSEKPLKLQAIMGLFLSITSFSAAIIYGMMALRGDLTVSGFATLIISICFLSGLIIFSLGIIGLYIGNIFNQVKNRPNYFIDETN